MLVSSKVMQYPSTLCNLPPQVCLLGNSTKREIFLKDFSAEIDWPDYQQNETIGNQRYNKWLIKKVLMELQKTQGDQLSVIKGTYESTCQGDSGGPLIVTVFENNETVPYLYGVTSWGYSGKSLR